MFLVKQPSVVCRVLSSNLCPPHDVLHDIETYPLFYDPLYYPQYHLHVFSTAENFCSWLQLGICTGKPRGTRGRTRTRTLAKTRTRCEGTGFLRVSNSQTRTRTPRGFTRGY